MKTLSAIALGMILLAGVVPTQARAVKVLICHIPGGATKGKVIAVAEEAVPAHLDHGDFTTDSPQGTACENRVGPETL